VLAKGRELQTSNSGRLVEHEDFHRQGVRLQELRKNIDDSLQALSRARSLKPAEEAIKEITAECQKISQEFQDALSKFEAQPGQTPWKSIRQAFRAEWKKDGLQAKQQRLQGLSEQLMLHLLMVIR
jgi:hypothetical protein